MKIHNLRITRRLVLSADLYRKTIWVFLPFFSDLFLYFSDHCSPSSWMMICVSTSFVRKQGNNSECRTYCLRNPKYASHHPAHVKTARQVNPDRLIFASPFSNKKHLMNHVHQISKFNCCFPAFISNYLFSVYSPPFFFFRYEYTCHCNNL